MGDRYEYCERTKLSHHIEDYKAELQSDGSYLHNDGDVYWYKDGNIHREDGPAVIRCDTDGGYVQWHLGNNKYSFDDWCRFTNCSDERKMMLRLQYG